MKFLIIILILSIPIFVNAQENIGVNIEKIDSTIIAKVQVVSFENYNVYVFPKEYGNRYFRNKKECFDLDTVQVRDIDKELINQYFGANKKFMEIRFKEMFAMKGINPGAHDWKALKRDEKKYWKVFNKNKYILVDKVTFGQRQYLGYINEQGEKILLIQLVDFREDPYGLKRYVNNQFISGWHGWFYSNVSRMHYHLETGKITVNEDF